MATFFDQPDTSLKTNWSDYIHQYMGNRKDLMAKDLPYNVSLDKQEFKGYFDDNHTNISSVVYIYFKRINFQYMHSEAFAGLNLVSLKFEYCNLKQLPELNSVSNTVEFLHIHDSQIREIPMDYFEGFSNLNKQIQGIW